MPYHTETTPKKPVSGPADRPPRSAPCGSGSTHQTSQPPDGQDAISSKFAKLTLEIRQSRRSIAAGTGDMNRLSLPYLTIESDVKPGDLLVSSGLDDVFPAGYPVARVSRVERNPAETFALVEAKPLAQLDRDREVLLLWVDRPAEQQPEAQAPRQAAAAKP